MNLDNFTGTESYHYLNFMKNIKATDGIAYLCKEAKCYWLIDIVASIQHLKKIVEKQNFIVWRVVKVNDGCKVEAYYDSEEDGTYSKDKLLYSQEMDYTDFPFNELNNEFEFYQIGDVVLLKSEH